MAYVEKISITDLKINGNILSGWIINNGNRSVKRVDYTISYLDKNNKVISEFNWFVHAISPSEFIGPNERKEISLELYSRPKPNLSEIGSIKGKAKRVSFK